MPFLNLDIDYFDHPKTKRLVRLLGRGSEVLPLRLWVYTARYFVTSGELTGVSAQEIEDECRWWGNKGAMVDAMLRDDIRLLERRGESFIVHDWEEHQGHLVSFKERAKTAANARWNRPAKGDATSIPRSSATSNAPTKPTIPTNQTKTLSEREVERMLAKAKKGEAA